MSHRIPSEIRLKALAYFREGYRSHKISKLIKSVCRATSINWQNRYDRGALYTCPVCGAVCKAHDFKDFTWRHDPEPGDTETWRISSRGAA